MSEKKYRAWFQANADAFAEFTANVDHLPEDERREALEDAAYAAFQGVILCHQCARHTDLGDFELGTNDDAIEVLS